MILRHVTHKTTLSALLFAVAVTTFSGCSTWDKLDRTERGAVIGGGTGAIIGDSVSPGVGGTVVGGALGAVAGGAIGRETDRRRDRY